MGRAGHPALRSISPDDAGHLVASGEARVLDVRTPEEFSRLGHIPGAILLPVDLVASAPATLPRDGRTLLVCCEHGIRSAHAAHFLVQAGLPGVVNLAGGMAAWRGPRSHDPGDPFASGPSSWIVACADLLPRGGEALDIACGAGRHALLLASAGYRVRALDRDAGMLETLREAAGRLGLPVRAKEFDLEAAGADLGAHAYDLIVAVHYLHRPLFPAIVRALRRGGLLLYETFTIDQARRGRPTNPGFLLEPGELGRLVRPLDILRQREGDFEGRSVASVAARKA